jgi:hypothetical protein
MTSFTFSALALVPLIVLLVFQLVGRECSLRDKLIRINAARLALVGSLVSNVALFYFRYWSYAGGQSTAETPITEVLASAAAVGIALFWPWFVSWLPASSGAGERRAIAFSMLSVVSCVAWLGLSLGASRDTMGYYGFSHVVTVWIAFPIVLLVFRAQPASGKATA